MSWLRCQVEMRSERSPDPITDEFEGRSLFEVGWLALCTWCQQWYYDPGATIVIRHAGNVWRVSPARIQAWRPLVSRQEAGRVLHEARASQAPLFDKRPEAL